LLIVIIPHWSQVLDPRGARLVKLFPRFADDVDMDIVAKRFVPRIRQIPDVETIDLLPFLREHASAESWALDFHFSSRGHELWFEAVRDPVRALVSAEARPER
jgi:lysophospholipase L1-like esterase